MVLYLLFSITQYHLPEFVFLNFEKDSSSFLPNVSNMTVPSQRYAPLYFYV